MVNKVQLAIEAINKRLGYEALFSGASKKKIVTKRIKTGIKSLDVVTNGGFPIGKITEIFGVFSSGKSLICALAAKEAQKNNKIVAWVDTENSVDRDYMERLGLDTDNMIFSQPSDGHSYGENLIDVAITILKMGRKEYKEYPKVGLLVIDSLAGLVSKAELEGSAEDQMIAPNARMINRAVRKMNTVNRHTAIIFINQLRSGIGFHATDVTPGGRGLGFFAALRIQAKVIEKFSSMPEYLGTTKAKTTGQRVMCRVTKSKICAPFGEATFDFYYEPAKIDHIRDFISGGMESGEIKRAGPYYEIDGNKFRGEKDLIAYLKDNI